MIAAALAAAATLTMAQRSGIDGLVKSAMSSAHIAGATVEVSIGGRPAYVKAFGYADLAARRPAAAGTVYGIGSVTKQFTAAALLLLAQDGKLSIDDPLSRYVPGLPWGDRVTLRHLLDQESGVSDFRTGVIDYGAPVSHDAILDRLRQSDLLFAPGSKYEYSNSNYYLLGLVVERASGETYADFLRSRVLMPLGLSSTYYGAESVPRTALARGTLAGTRGAQPVAAENADWAYAAGALASTAPDLARWDALLRSGPLLRASSREEMFAPGVLDDGSPTDYAFGWVVVRHNGHREVWHNGEITGFHAMNATYPDDKTDVVVLTNTGGTFAADELAVRIFDALHPLAPSPADRAATARAREWLGRIAHGDVDRSQLTDDMSRALTDPVVASAGEQLRAYGPLRSVDLKSVDEDASGRNYSFRATFAKQAVRWVMGIDARGKISALFFHPLDAGR